MFYRHESLLERFLLSFALIVSLLSFVTCPFGVMYSHFRVYHLFVKMYPLAWVCHLFAAMYPLAWVCHLLVVMYPFVAVFHPYSSPSEKGLRSPSEALTYSLTAHVLLYLEFLVIIVVALSPL